MAFACAYSSSYALGQGLALGLPDGEDMMAMLFVVLVPCLGVV